VALTTLEGFLGFVLGGSLGVTVLGWTDGYHARASTGSRNVEEPPSGVHGRSAPRAHRVRASPDSTPFSWL